MMPEELERRWAAPGERIRPHPRERPVGRAAKSERCPKEDHGHNRVVGAVVGHAPDAEQRWQTERLAAARLDQPDRHRKNHIDDDVLDHGDRQHDAGKASAEQTHVVHDP